MRTAFPPFLNLRGTIIWSKIFSLENNSHSVYLLNIHNLVGILAVHVTGVFFSYSVWVCGLNEQIWTVLSGKVWGLIISLSGKWGRYWQNVDWLLKQQIRTNQLLICAKLRHCLLRPMSAAMAVSRVFGAKTKIARAWPNLILSVSFFSVSFTINIGCCQKFICNDCPYYILTLLLVRFKLKSFIGCSRMVVHGGYF